MSLYRLREWRADDAESIAKYMNRNISDNLRDGIPDPYTAEDGQEYIVKAQKADPVKSLQLAIDVGGEAVGSIGVFVLDNVYCRGAEIGYWLGEPFWGKGIMSAAVREICALAFGRLDIVRIEAGVFSFNTGSRRVLEKAGFTLEGILRQSVSKNGRMHDAYMYALLKDE